MATTILSLAKDLADLAGRVAALEEAMAQHQAGAAERQAEMDRLNARVGVAPGFRPGDNP